MKSKKLQFGNPESIAYVRRLEAQNIAKKLVDTLKCPYCKKKAILCFHLDLESDEWGINFDCAPFCKNSAEYSEKYDQEMFLAKIYFNSKGKLINDQDVLGGQL